MIASIARLALIPNPGSNRVWPRWHEISGHRLLNHMGKKPDHFPMVEVRLAYDKKALHVMFRVDDKYVRAVAARNQDRVCSDSCVEFFFTPGAEVSQGYFNLEMNCGGTLLFHYHPESADHVIVVSESDCDLILKRHSLPRLVDPEIREDVTWTVEYSIPFALLQKYTRVVTPRPRSLWRGNFYKCADHSSHPHWLTWAPVDHPVANFHLPQFFGMLKFQ